MLTSDMSGIMTKVSLALAAASEPYARTTSERRSPTMPTSRLGLACSTTARRKAAASAAWLGLGLGLGLELGLGLGLGLGMGFGSGSG